MRPGVSIKRWPAFTNTYLIEILLVCTMSEKLDFKICVVADVSCDIDGPVASTIRPSKIDSPIYGYNPITESEDELSITFYSIFF